MVTHNESHSDQCVQHILCVSESGLGYLVYVSAERTVILLFDQYIEYGRDGEISWLIEGDHVKE